MIQSTLNYRWLGTIACIGSLLIICAAVIALPLGILLGLSLAPAAQESSAANPNTPTVIVNFSPENTPVPVALELTPFQAGSPANGELLVHFIDVDQGDSIFIQSPDGATALIDGGYDNGLALAYLQQQGITRIDVMIASHPHADHIGGLIQVMQTMPVGEIWTSGASHTTGIFETFLDTIIEKQIPYYEATRGTTIRVGSLEFITLYGQPNADELNNTSLVLRLTYGTTSFLFTGDAEYAAEMDTLANVRDQLQAQILKVGHHGSYTSSSPEFLAAVQPEIAIYSAGRGNTYGHPHEETITHLTTVGATIYGTDVHGTVVVASDGSRYQIRFTIDAPPVGGSPAVPITLIPATVPNAVVTPIGTSGYDPNGPDRDCGSFETHAEAQAFFIAAGGPSRDLHRLDGDNDGIACESLP